MLFAVCQSLFPSWLETGKVRAGMSTSPLWASRPCRVPGPKSAQSLSYLLLLSGGKSKVGKSFPKTAAGSWWAPGAEQETGKGGGWERGIVQQKWARIAVTGDGARPSPCPRLTQEKANN